MICVWKLKFALLFDWLAAREIKNEENETNLLMLYMYSLARQVVLKVAVKSLLMYTLAFYKTSFTTWRPTLYKIKAKEELEHIFFKNQTVQMSQRNTFS